MKLESRAMVSPEGTFSFPVGHIDSPCLPMKIMQIIYLIIVYTFLEFKGPFSIKVHSIFLFRAILRHETNLLEFTTRTNLLDSLLSTFSINCTFYVYMHKYVHEMLTLFKPM